MYRKITLSILKPYINNTEIYETTTYIGGRSRWLFCVTSSLRYTGSFKIKYTIWNPHNFHSVIDTNLKQKPFGKEGLKFFLFDAWLRPFCETHRVKCCDKNVSLFQIVRRKMAYLLISLKSEFIRSEHFKFLSFWFNGRLIRKNSWYD